MKSFLCGNLIVQKMEPYYKAGMQWIFLILVSAICGVSIGLGYSFLFVFFIVLAMGLVLIMKLPWLLYSLTIMSLFGIGVLESFLNIAQANWLVVVLAAMLIPALLIQLLGTYRKGSFSFTRLDVFVFLYMLSILFSGMVNLTSGMQFLVGMKAYLPFIFVYYCLSLGPFSFKNYRVLLNIILAIGCAQILVNGFIYFFIAPRIHGGMGEYESIIGSFGGSFYTGGYSGEHIIFLCMIFFASFILVQMKQINPVVLFLSAISLFGSVALAETKVFFVIFPVVVFLTWYFSSAETYHLNVRFIATACVVLFLIVTVYSIRFWSNEAGGAEHAFLYSFDPDFMISPTQRGRVGEVVHWFNTVPLSGNILNAIFGYGPGASVGGANGQGSIVSGIGNAVALFGPGLDVSALTKILWDFGFFGLFSLFAVVSEALKLAFTSMKSAGSKSRLSGLIIFSSWLVILFSTLPYQPGIVGGVAFQFLFWLSISMIQLLAWRLRDE